jgi:hypothetical protein
MPVNYYAALVIIVVLGIGSVFIARYHYAKGSPVVQPAVGQTWHAALEINICGTREPSLLASPASTTSGLSTTGSGILLIAPKSSSESGNNATLGKFASEYSGMTLTNSALKYPNSKIPEYKNGEKCAKGTPDAGEKGVVRVRTWTLVAGKSTGKEVKLSGGAYSTKPTDVKLRNGQLLSLGFVPASKPLPKVNALTEVALLQLIEGTGPVVSTTTPPATTSSTAVTPTTAAVTSTTTAPVTTTSTKRSTTTTTK